MKVVITPLESNDKMKAISVEEDNGNQVFSIGYSEDPIGSAFLRLSGDIQNLEADIAELTDKFRRLQQIRIAISAYAAESGL